MDENQDLLEKQKMDAAYTQMAGEEEQDASNVLSTIVADEATKNPKVMSVLAQASEKLKSLEPTVSLNDYDASQASRNPDAVAEDELALLKNAARSKIEGKAQAQAVPTEAIESFQVPTEAYTYAEKGDVGSSLGALQEGLALQKSGILSSAAAQSQGYMEQAGATSKAVSDMVNASKQSAIKMEEWDSRIQEQMDKQSQAVEDLKSIKINGDNFWANRSTQDKLLMGIGMALSAYGGKESVQSSIKLIDEAINRDIVVQKANAELAQDDVHQRSNLISQLRGSLGDARQAEELVRAGAFQQAQLVTQAISAKTNSKVASANAQTLLGELKLKEAEALSRAQEAIPQQVARTMQASINAGGIIPWEEAQRQRLIGEKDLKNLVPKYGLVADGQDPRKLADGISGYKDLKAIILEMAELTKKHGGELFSTDVSNRLSTLKEQGTLALKDTKELGAMGADVQSLVDRLIGMDLSYVSPRRTWIRTASGEAEDPMYIKLKQYARDVDASFANKMESTFKVGTPDLLKMVAEARRSQLAASAKER